jgi:hypothetical protein
MIITRAEAMKAVIDGVPIQNSTDQINWINSFAGRPYILIVKLKAIYYAHCDVVFRLKPEVRTISYRCFLYTNLAGTFDVSVCSSASIALQKECEEYPDFVKWIGETVTVEIGE